MPILTAVIQQHITQLLGKVDSRLEDPDRRDTWRAVLNHTHKVAERTAGEEEKIRQNRNLSPEGQREELRKLATKQVGELKFLHDALGKSHEAHKTMSDLLFTTQGQRQLDKVYDRQPEPAEENPVLRFLREQEVRNDWRLKTQPERDAEYLRAVQAGDREIVRALSNAPGGPLVTADVKRRADVDYAERQFPAAFKNFGQISVLREQLIGLNDLITKWLDGLGTQA